MNREVENLLDEFKQGLTMNEYDSYIVVLHIR